MKKFIVSVVFSLSLFGAFTSAFAAAGSLDPTFGNAGKVDTDFGPNGNNFSFADAVLAPNGDIVVAGTVANLDGQQSTCVVVRYLPSGALDSSFGGDGMVTLPAQFFASLFGGMAVQPDGKILVLTQPEINNTFVIALLRLNNNGDLDPTFGSAGQVIVKFPAPATFAASPNLVLAQPDGKILLAGSATPPFRSKLTPQTVLARYLSNGTLDTTFGSGGFSSAVAISTPSTLALLSGDGILALNSSEQLAQFTSAGALLKTPTGGTVIAVKRSVTPQTFLSNAEDLEAGIVQGPFGRRNIDAVISKFQVSGVADPSFASPAITFLPNGGNVQSGVGSIALDSQGRIALGGAVATVGTSTWALARLQPNGNLDTTFGSGGVVTTQVGLGGFIGIIFVQPDNKILAIGEVQVSKDTNNTLEDLAIVRYLAQ
jgi:uncharacterized delta-60 repeat protein